MVLWHKPTRGTRFAFQPEDVELVSCFLVFVAPGLAWMQTPFPNSLANSCSASIPSYRNRVFASPSSLSLRSNFQLVRIVLLVLAVFKGLQPMIMPSLPIHRRMQGNQISAQQGVYRRSFGDSQERTERNASNRECREMAYREQGMDRRICQKANQINQIAAHNPDLLANRALALPVLSASAYLVLCRRWPTIRISEPVPAHCHVCIPRTPYT
ncbi:hypothetical protein VTL71DRAFT_6791 [Oculimacula yallundae]|uniref:Uncharacterized protein n=1 Tax=Oculimacula yallundae TaxID=86028 RepID=A0ABR4BY37_9HELO